MKGTMRWYGPCWPPSPISGRVGGQRLKIEKKENESGKAHVAGSTGEKEILCGCTRDLNDCFLVSICIVLVCAVVGRLANGPLQP